MQSENSPTATSLASASVDQLTNDVPSVQCGMLQRAARQHLDKAVVRCRL